MNAIAGEYRAAARDAKAAWGPTQTAAGLILAFGCAVPWIAPGWVHVDVLAAWLYLALAATGLGLTVGIAGLPSLGQGAFMSIGAFTTALLAARAGWSADAAVPVAVGASLVAGLLAGLVVVRQPPLFLAVSTWILSWLVLLVALEFPGVAGGSQGYVVTSSLSTTGHYELALLLTATAVAALSALRRSNIGIRLRAHRDDPAAAAGLGVPTRRLLLGAFVASSAVGGLAGSLAVQLAGVSDPNAFGPFTSFELLAAVLLGGASYACAGIAGVAILGAVALLGHAWAAVQGDAPAQLQPMLASLLLLAILGVGGQGLIPLLVGLRGRSPSPPDIARDPAVPATGDPAALSARALQRTATFGNLTVLENALVGAGLRARHSGPVRLLVATPKARAEARRSREAAIEALRTVGLDRLADVYAELLDGFQRRLLMIAAALATRPRLLLLDEPSAGAGRSEISRLAAILTDVRATGVSLLLVEHNFQLVQAVADRVVVMSDGKEASTGVS